MSATDRAEIIELMSSYADIPDRARFAELPQRVFTDPVTLDFGSVAGTPVMEVPVAAYGESLKETFAPFVAAHHVITGHVVRIDGDRATVSAHVRAEHWFPSEVTGDGPNCWLVVGFYDNEAVRTSEGWRLSRVKLTATYQENAHLLSAVLPAGSKA
ncbi:nuclear transport factor 2 family protein [Streptomyces spiramenti]|uniref:Nuclear transport factor 2 family protein n=1 Tax=Streptomyces spiramenti TaxID=2720606 RepID=A0ABX1AW85_9ACTN|nr:nuclear transport factor 2 family protein [Streptomyces spiramenti]NJP68517.1 nuclear transport factor 2 family protein [Streptomyces spiramenti]